MEKKTKYAIESLWKRANSFSYYLKMRQQQYANDKSYKAHATHAWTLVVFSSVRAGCNLLTACKLYDITQKRDRTDDVMKTPLGICFRGFPLL